MTAQRVVWRYTAHTTDDVTWQMPEGAVIIAAETRIVPNTAPAAPFLELNVWALVDPTAPPTPRRVILVGTGVGEVPVGARHLATSRVRDLVLHAFEVHP